MAVNALPDALAPYLSAHHRAWLADGGPRHRCTDGTLLFLDVSGFTPLTERLARKGKVGGEELTDHLNAVFAPLIEAADALGGDVLKFGGDALLLLFAGPGHERRGLAAGWDMQRAMRPFERMRTSAGVLPLRASSAVASGPVHLFLAGEDYDEQVAAGPTMTECLRLEAAAEAGEVLAAAATAAHAREAVRAGRDGGYLLQRRPDADVVAPASPVLVDARRGLPAQLHDELGQGESGEHRRAVVSFVQVRRLDVLLEQEGPEVAASELDRLLADVQRACRRHDVTFLTTDADQGAIKVMLVAGAPRAHADDADRMLRCVREIVGPERALVLRAGVNRGRVFALDVGSPLRRTYSTMGDATNLAARVMGKAPDGEVLATRAVADALRGGFGLAAVDPFTVKGKTVPVEAFVVAGETGTAGVPGAIDAPTAVPGREAEMATIRALVTQGSGIVEVTGEPGIGKSRLVAGALAIAREAARRTLVVEGGAYGAHAAFLALRRPLRDLLGLDAAAPEPAVLDALRAAGSDDAVALLAPVAGVDLPPAPGIAELDADALRRRRAIATAALLEHRLPAGALIVIEDAHWLDVASAELLRAVLATPAARRWAVLTLRRDGDEGLRLGDEHGAAAIALGPLPERAARGLVLEGALAGGAIPPDAIAGIVERAGGNPLALRELVAAVRAGHDVDDLPEGIEELLAGSIDRLAAPDRRALRELAVLGARFPRAWAAALLGLDAAALDAQLDRLSGFVEDEPTGLAFQHALQRVVAYEALAFRRRRDLHQRAMTLIVAERGAADIAPVVELLALHAHHARSDAEAWTWAGEGARRAQARGAPAEALTLFAWALEAGARLPDVSAAALAGVESARGTAAEFAGRLELALDAFRRAGRRTTDPLERADLCRRAARVCERLGRYPEALAWATRGRGHLDRADGAAVARRAAVAGGLGIVAGMARVRQGRAREALALLDAAIATLRTAEDAPKLAHALYVAASAAVETGDTAIAERHHHEALELFEAAGDLAGAATVHNNLGVDAYFVGDWTACAHHYARARELRARTGDPVHVAEADLNIAELLADQGRLDEAEPLFAETLTIFEAAPLPAAAGLAVSDLGRLAARRGGTDLALERLADARGRLTALGALAMVLEVRVREAEALALGARFAEALDAVEALDLGALPAGRYYVATLERVRGWALAGLGDAAGAAAALHRSLADARAQDSGYDELATLDALDRLGAAGADADRAAQLRAALDVRALPHPLAG